ncbi:cation-transporting P-type ATPase [Iamia sp. SCSIO 61187]|nr:cation-transporting P-type ATPase [Iamia sp. SCSIO 61187]
MAPPAPAPGGEGLSDEEARRRLVSYGPNQLSEPPSRSALALLLDQFRNLLVVVLIGAALLAGAVGDIKDATVITVVLVLNAVLGFVQENRAEKSLAALRSMLVATARVRRGGREVEVPASELVPGDVVLLDAGDRVPADARLAVARSLEVDESSLTGESVAVEKDASGPHEGGALAERSGAVFMNTVITRGRGEAVVTATGMATEIGAVAELLQGGDRDVTPLQRQLDGLGKRLALVAGAAVALYITLELMRGSSLGDTLLSAVALAVAAIPEGLPAVVTVTLAVGTYQMAKRGAIVKRLASVETLGATSVICSDKTGTLTMNQMTARALVTPSGRCAISGEGYRVEGAITPTPGDEARAALRAGLLCNDSKVDDDGTLLGDPTEGALVTAAQKAGLDPAREGAARPRVNELPFESARKLMATFHDDGTGTLVLVKGAADVVLDLVDLEPGDRQRWEATIDELAGEGLRVLALADRHLAERIDPEAPPSTLEGALGSMRLLGLVGLLDPPRPEAREAIALCRRAGIAVTMITGDHASTASSIARDLGIRGEAITGAELDALDDEALASRIDRIGVVARVSPEHKVRMVRALKERGHVVAMTGDGVNDAPALRAADIGVAMGITGTEVSKEAAAMVLTDDDFATIVTAVERGRAIYANIVTFVRFQLATNLGAIASLLGAPLLGLPVPFTAIQILWVNIIMDGPPAMALGVDPPSPAAMEAPPRRPGAAILDGRRLGVLVMTGLVMAIGTLGVLAWADGRGSEAEALTLAFTTFVLFQVGNALNARAEGRSVFHRATLTNGKLWAALAAVVLLQVAAVQLESLHGLMGTTHLTIGQWALAIAIASTVIWVEEARKGALRIVGGRRSQPTAATSGEQVVR